MRLTSCTAIPAVHCGDGVGTKLSLLCKSPPRATGPRPVWDRGVCLLRGGAAPQPPRCPLAPDGRGPRRGQSSGCGLALSLAWPLVERVRGLHSEVSPSSPGKCARKQAFLSSGSRRGRPCSEFPFSPTASRARPTPPTTAWAPTGPSLASLPNGSASVRCPSSGFFSAPPTP